MKGINLNVDKYIKEERILKGIVEDVISISDKTKALKVSFNNLTGIISEKNIDILKLKKNDIYLKNMIGKHINFVIINENNDGTLECSRKRYKEILRDRLMLKLNNNEIVEGKVYKIVNKGAYLNVNGIVVIMRNGDFSKDKTLVKDVLKVGDIIPIKLNTLSKNTIFVQAVNKYEKNNKPVQLEEKDIDLLIEKIALFLLMNNDKEIDKSLEGFDNITRKYILKMAESNAKTSIMNHLARKICQI